MIQIWELQRLQFEEHLNFVAMWSFFVNVQLFAHVFGTFDLSHLKYKIHNLDNIWK